jgi:hypothetical protein
VGAGFGGLGAKGVHLFCLEKREEMPAHAWEIARAEEEGVVIHNSWGPRKVLGDHAVTGLGLVRCASVFDAAGAFNPTYDEKVSTKVEGRTVILAVGQSAELGYLAGEGNIRSKGGRIQVEENTLATGERGVFAGGDLITGPNTIVDAIAAGKKAAIMIDRYIRGEALKQPGQVRLPQIYVEPAPACDQPPEAGKRVETPRASVQWRKRGFAEFEMSLTVKEATREACSCISCDIEFTKPPASEKKQIQVGG